MMALCMMSYNFCRKHQTLKSTPAQAAEIASKQWTLDDVVRMMDEYSAGKEAEAFEAAFAKFVVRPRTSPKTYKPTPKDQIPTPWYLNPESDGEPESP